MRLRAYCGVPDYWFPAKRYGWGWGLPSAWQGWVVLAVYCAVVLIAALARPLFGLPVVASATVVLLLIGLKKGEPTRWRWGGEK